MSILFLISSKISSEYLTKLKLLYKRPSTIYFSKRSEYPSFYFIFLKKIIYIKGDIPLINKMIITNNTILYIFNGNICTKKFENLPVVSRLCYCFITLPYLPPPPGINDNLPLRASTISAAILGPTT